MDGEQSYRWASGSVSALGILLFVRLVSHPLRETVILDHPGIPSAAEGVVLLIPAAGLTYAGYWLSRSEFRTRYRRRVAQWCFAGAVVSGAATGLVTLAITGALFPAIPTPIAYPSSVGLGAVAGTLIGVHEAYSLTSAERTARAELAAERAAAERDELAQLNDLLRHDVLNDVNVIRGHADLAMERAADDDLVHSLETIRRQSVTIEELVENVRALVLSSRTETPDEPRDVVAVAETEAAKIERAYDCVVAVDAPGSLLVVADDLVGSVFSNLIRNGVVHNDAETPRVRVTVTREGESAVVRIADDGPGIPPAERERLFEASDGSHGVGLSLVDTLVDRYGGDVRLASTGADGTEFVVELPLATVD